MSRLWPIGDDAPQPTHTLRPGFSITRFVAVITLSSGGQVCSALMEVLLLFTEEYDCLISFLGRRALRK